MGGRLVSDEESDNEDAMQARRLDNLDWSKLGRMAEESFKRTPTVEFMYEIVFFCIDLLFSFSKSHVHVV